MFRAVQSNVNFPALEAEVLRFWSEAGIYQKSLAQRAGAPKFVFYEGPPTANGLPHPGHCLTRAIKDLFPRYRTMRGYLCERKAGWDTHGLPVEVEVCKELGIHSKEQIEAYGVEPFIQKCQQSVWRYMKEWERLTERLGFWIRLDEAYVTYHQSYIESVWASLAELFNRGLLYQGHKIVWWWAQGGTALSAGEVGLGYREVADPSVYVRFPLLPLSPGGRGARGEGEAIASGDPQSPGEDLLVWTTTPWTLPSNQFAAVHPDLDYAVVSDPEIADRRLIIAAALVETIAAKVKRELRVERTFKGSELIGQRYLPPFRYYYDEQPDLQIGGKPARRGDEQGTLKTGEKEYGQWRVVAADFVTTESGTGVVHQAPAFGEVDFQVLIAEQQRFREGDEPRLICAVGPDGKFTAEALGYEGRWVKDADKDISRELRHRGLLYHQEQYLHEYPFCWRAEQDPLIQYPRQSWFIRTTAMRDEMLKNNRQINWLPEHIRDGRFGNFLESNVDWALSRERYWGTPLPIWVCEQTGFAEAVGSYEELLAKPGVRGTEVWDEAKKKNPELVDDLKVHKPYIDAITYDSTQPGAAPGTRMRRVPDVIDCWYDSGAMPFAQWGYPHRNREKFREQFPADFISEAIDQTRGWFYSLLAIGTLLFRDLPSSEPSAGAANRSFSELTSEAERKKTGSANWPAKQLPIPFRNCIVLGLMLGEDGQKMSKQKRNYLPPQEIFDRYGADALRWYFFANQPPWTTIRYSERAIKESIPEFLLRLWNVYSFFVIYARIDGFDPADERTALAGDAGELEPAVLARAKGFRPLKERGELDRWILSELNRTAETATAAMDAYDNYSACRYITEFVDALSNWYVRRSRDRFWTNDKTAASKRDAYWTLYECLLSTAKLIAPFVPFLAEALWQNLAVEAFGTRTVESVHLCDFPTGDTRAIDAALSRRMSLVREIASLGRSARMGAKLKVRQPLERVEVILADRSEQAWLADHAELLREELNVKQVEFTEQAEQYITYSVLPDLKRLGPRLGKRLPALKAALAKADAAELLARLERDKKVSLELADGPVELDGDDLQVRLQAKPGWAAAQGRACVVVLSTELAPELVLEGLARELVHAIQTRRRELNCEYTGRIEVFIETDSAELTGAIEQFRDYICGETLAVSSSETIPPGADASELAIGEYRARLFVKIV
ncbi:MAG TPA: class I tRNA ligase family protein [Pirellulales bacterium]|nr:class I tRNA ligase family protein [Pirellulales bacterium]